MNRQYFKVSSIIILLFWFGSAKTGLAFMCSMRSTSRILALIVDFSWNDHLQKLFCQFEGERNLGHGLRRVILDVDFWKYNYLHYFLRQICYLYWAQSSSSNFLYVVCVCVWEGGYTVRGTNSSNLPRTSIAVYTLNKILQYINVRTITPIYI